MASILLCPYGLGVYATASIVFLIINETRADKNEKYYFGLKKKNYSHLLLRTLKMSMLFWISAVE